MVSGLEERLETFDGVSLTILSEARVACGASPDYLDDLIRLSRSDPDGVAAQIRLAQTLFRFSVEHHHRRRGKVYADFGSRRMKLIFARFNDDPLPGWTFQIGIVYPS